MANDLDWRDGSTVVAVFDTTAEAETALDQLRDAGVDPANVSVMMRHQNDAQQLAADSGVNVAGGAATGAISGSLFGGLAGWLVGIGALAIPGIGPVLGAGVLVSVLTGAAIGAAAGGLLGALVGIGVPEEEAQTYEAYVKEGRVLLTIATTDEQQSATLRDALEGAGAYDVRIYNNNPQLPTLNSNPDSYGDYSDAAMSSVDQDLIEDMDRSANAPPPERAPVSGEAVGGAGGALVGGVIGAVIGGPIGAAIGAAVGGSAGAGAAHVMEEPSTGPVGSQIGGASGAFVGGLIGAAGGPIGAVIGAVAGGALGGASGEALQDAGEFMQERNAPRDRDAAADAVAVPAEDVVGAAAMANTVSDPGTGAATIPTDYRSGGEDARNATPEQLAQAVDRGIEPTADTSNSVTITPNTTETEYRSGGDASRGETQ